jgi:hypothetical protein
MAGIQWSWTKALVVLALVVAVGRVSVAQSPAANNGGTIAGRLTDVHSAPLAGVTVVARNQATGAEARTTTAKNGSYRFTGLAPGEYTLEAEGEHLGRGRLEGIFVAAGHEARVQTAMEFAPAAPRSIQRASTPAIQAPANPFIQTASRPAIKTAPTPAIHIASRPIILTASNPAFQTIVFPPIQTENLALVGSSAHSPVRAALHTIAAETPLVTTTVAVEPLLAIPIAGQSAPQPPRPQLAVERPAVGPPVIAASAQAAVLGLELKAPAWEYESSFTLTEPAEAAAKTAMLLAQLRLKAKLAADLAAARPDIEPMPPVVTTVTGAELQALPVSGRQWQSFVLDAPTSATATGGAAQTSLRGAGQEPIETTVDGASTRLAFGGQMSSLSAGQDGVDQNGMGQAWAGGHAFSVAEAAIREVQTVAGNVQAEGSRAAGGRMNVETERGANGLHGQGFLFDRQNTWGARNPFTQWVKETAPATETTSPVFTPEPYTPPDHETNWGLGAGSQIRRDKLFWFAALDSLQRNDPGLSMVKHPYLCGNPPQCTEQTGFFAQPSNDQMQVLSARLGLSSSNPVAEGLAAYSKMLETLDGLLGPAPRTATQWVGFSRIDWEAAERHRFTLEGIGATWDSPGGGLTNVSETYGSNSFGSSQASQEWLLGRWEGFVTPNLLLVTQGSMGRSIESARPETPSPFEQAFLSPNVWGQLPQIVVDSRYGFTIGNPSRFGPGSYPDERLYQGQESVYWVRGRLLVKAGFDVSHNFDVTSLLRNQTGTYIYSSVENFASDALSFAAFGVAGELNSSNQHNCDQTGKVWRDSTGKLRGLGYLPCYASYSQLMGPAVWDLSTNDWAGFETTQWQVGKLLVFSAGLRWEREQLPPPIATLANSELPLTQKLPSLGNSWGPRASLALGSQESHWPVLRVGYGMYFGRTENATVETALTQTGSPNGDQSFFMRPTDNLNAGGAPPFPYVFSGPPGTLVKPGAVEFAPEFRNPEIDQGVVALEEELPGHVQLTAGALISLGRRLPISIDTNFDSAVNPGTITYAVVDGTGAGPIKSAEITVPFYASWPSSNSPTELRGRLNPGYQQITQIMSKANSTYEAAIIKITRYGRRGLSLHAHYTYSHAMDWNPNESTTVAGSDVLDPANFSQEYGTSNLDVRHSAASMLIYEAPWKQHGLAGWLANGWVLSGTGQFRSGMPYTMRTGGSLAEEFTDTGTAIVGLGPGMNGSGGDNRVYGVGRNTYRYPATWKADMRLGKSFDFGHMRQLELLAESFNLFNHQNVTELETTGYTIESGSPGSLPTLNFLTGPVVRTNGTIAKPNTTEFGQPLNINANNFYRERQIQVGLRIRF